MRVVQLGSVPPPRGGIQSNISAISERLLTRGDECSLVAITRSSEIIAQPDVYHPRSPPELARLLLRLKFDVLHLHLGGNFTARLAGLAFFCGLLPNCRKVLTFHSGGFASSPLGRAANKRDLRGIAARRFDKIIAVNQEIKNLFERYGVEPARIEIVAPHVLRQPDAAVEIPFALRDFAENHQPLLLSVGLLEKHYDLPIQIKAFAAVRAQYQRAGLMIIGSGSQQNNLRELIAQSLHHADIALPGDVPNEIVLHLIKRADVLLRTTLYDGDAISVRESLFLGTPVIATDNKMRPANVKLFPVGDAEKLETAILEQLAAGRLPNKNDADDYSNIDRVLAIYDELMVNGEL